MTKPMRIGVLGASGSIGRQALDVIDSLGCKVTLLASGTRYDKLLPLINKYKPKIAVCGGAEQDAASTTKVINDLTALSHPDLYEDCDIVINGIGGIDGLSPSLAVIQSAASLATANKESFVSAGELITSKAKAHNKEILPLDSEHSAVWQCLNIGERPQKITLTASGGAFRDYTKEELKGATAQMALNHPTWQMGQKVTIDSATLVNKAMEIVEAKWLFDTDNIEVLIHRQSIVHAFVELADGAAKAALSMPDMRLPIQYALTYPARLPCINAPSIDDFVSLQFEKPDYDRFPCLALGNYVKKNPDAGKALVAADEVAVALYLAGKISFYEVYDVILSAMDKYSHIKTSSLEDVLSIDREIKEYTLSRWS
ncbi:MAG: 1-deoxy-D-xylulose-5-phosphate reductoisomerase [Clostridia bacterium]